MNADGQAKREEQPQPLSNAEIADRLASLAQLLSTEKENPRRADGAHHARDGQPLFNILGHATGRLLLKRPSYDIDVDRIVQHARRNGCFFEINSSPDRLDLSADHARRAAEAGVMIAVSTDSHSTREFDLIRCGLDQARRAGLQRASVLNCQPWESLERLFRR